MFVYLHLSLVIGALVLDPLNDDCVTPTSPSSASKFTCSLPRQASCSAGAARRFGAEPNTQTCPVCIGLPGSLPVMNRGAYELALKTAVALNCKIPGVHQVGSQAVLLPRPCPRAIRSANTICRCRPTAGLRSAIPKTALSPSGSASSALTLEEDAGKSMHDEIAGRADSEIDLNRAGTPLLEIVTQPDMRSPRRGQGVSSGAQAAAHLPGRLGLQHAGRQPARRRQRQPAHRQSTARRSPRRSSK